MQRLMLKAKKANRLKFDPKRLARAHETARRVLMPFRENRNQFVTQYVGDRWSNTGSPAPVPIPLLGLYIQTMRRMMVTQNPRVLYTTPVKEQKPAVSVMQQWVNENLEKYHAANVLQRICEDALFTIGVGMVALSTPSDAMMSGYNTPAGTAFFSRVDLDDWAFDPFAREFEEVDWEGHRYRAVAETIRDSKLYTKEARDLPASEWRITNETGDERITEVGMSDYIPEEFDEKIDLWQFYLPSRRLVVTMSTDGGGLPDKVIREQDWIGPDCGPYYHHTFNRVPGSAMPLSPVQTLYALHMLVNNLWRKLDAQSRRQKQVLAVDGKNIADGEAIKKANDGDAIRVNDPKSATVMNFGGPDPNNFQFEEAASMKFKEMAGNLDAIAGLGPQAKTAKQDSMLHEAASQAVLSMQEATLAFTTKVMTGLGWFFHHDPMKVMKVRYELQGLPDYSIDRKLTPRQRLHIPFHELQLRVDPYSLLQQTPQQRNAALDAVVTNVIIPLLPMIKGQGADFDVAKYLEMKAQYMDLPEIKELVPMSEPPVLDAERQEPGGAEPGPGPAQTERRYVRENVSERTNEGNSLMLQNRLLGMNDGSAKTGAGQIPGQGQ